MAVSSQSRQNGHYIAITPQHFHASRIGTVAGKTKNPVQTREVMMVSYLSFSLMQKFSKRLILAFDVPNIIVTGSELGSGIVAALLLCIQLLFEL